MYINIQVRRNNNHIIYFIKNSISIFRNAVLCFCLLISMQVDAQWFSTPQNLNGNPNEVYYTKDINNSRLYIGWDDDYLYLGKRTFVTPVVIYFDFDPYFPVSGGSFTNGNLLGVTHYHHTMDLPFRWDMALYWEPTGGGTSYIEYKERDGLGGTTIQLESTDILEDSLATIGSYDYGECKIRWSDINGTGGTRPNSFNWYAYQFFPNLNPGFDYVEQPVPINYSGVINPFGHISGTTKVYYYQT
ncbi:MAG: hypothetical protein KA954_13085, partial [Chitinophagales bacterium]|nr:hypothetical protein [Chitinophagales bacterium]